MALIVVPIIGTQSYKIRNLFFFFFIPIVLFGIINFITIPFYPNSNLINFKLRIKAVASIAIAFIIYRAFKYIRGRGFLQTISIPKISADEDEDLTDITKVGFFTKIYLFILKICINHPLKIAIVAVSLLIGIYTAYGNTVRV